MDAGDADVEAVAVAPFDAELVLAVAALRAREASTRASGRARADEATTDGDPGWTRETLTWRVLELPSTTLSVSSPSPPYACEKRRRERQAPRAHGRGDDGWGSQTDAGDADGEVVLVAGLDGERVLVVAALCAREASTRASGRARDEATTEGDPGRTRETLT